MSIIACSPWRPRSVACVAAMCLAILSTGCDSSVPGSAERLALPPGQAPVFEDHPASAEPFAGEAAAPDFSSLPGARMFATPLRRGAPSGPNFAGRYTVVTWDCGSDCNQFMILDAQTGAIFDGFTTRGSVDFRPDSDLLIIEPGASAANGRGLRQYYRWTGERLDFLGEAQH